jgi:hypothetical protein
VRAVRAAKSADDSPRVNYIIHAQSTHTEVAMSIVRVGMSEDNKFGTGYDAIFGAKPKKSTAKPAKKATTKKPAKKKPAKKK